jgi:hypothetical protein
MLRVITSSLALLLLLGCAPLFPEGEEVPPLPPIASTCMAINAVMEKATLQTIAKRTPNWSELISDWEEIKTGSTDPIITANVIRILEALALMAESETYPQGRASYLDELISVIRLCDEKVLVESETNGAG